MTDHLMHLMPEAVSNRPSHQLMAWYPAHTCRVKERACRRPRRHAAETAALQGRQQALKGKRPTLSF